MNEWHMILSFLWSAGLFSAGGTDLNGRGYKFLRRFILPAGLGCLALLYSHWWACIGYTLTLSAFLHLGYGSRAGWLYRSFIFTGYGCSALWLGFTWWAVITPVICLATFWLSNNKYMANTFKWKIVESLYGFLISSTYITALG